MEKSDAELLKEYSERRSDEAFRALARRHGPIVYGACLRHLNNPDLAEDAAQAVFLILARRAAQIRVHTTLVPWCLAAAKNVCRRLARSESRRKRHERPLTPDLEAENSIADAALFTALEGLRSDEREAIVLRFVQGLSLAEVGQAQGVTEDAARMRVNRGLARLKRKVITPIAVPASLLDRLSRVSQASGAIQALAFPPALSTAFVPTKFAAVGIGAVLAVGVVVLPRRVHPKNSNPAFPISSTNTIDRQETQSKIGLLNKPFTLEYRFTIESLSPQERVDANLAVEKKQIDADLDADHISVEEHDRRIADAIRRSKIRRREGRITLSFDGVALLITQNMTSPDPGQHETLFRNGESLELFSGNSCCYWWPKVFMSVVPDIPLFGPSLPYLPTQKGVDLLDLTEGLTYRPGKVRMNKDGSVAEFAFGPNKKGQYFERYVLTGDTLIQGQHVARKIIRTLDNSSRTEYTLISGRSEALPQDRFLPDAYLSEDQPIQLNLADNKYKLLNFSRSKGSADEQIAARRGQP